MRSAETLMNGDVAIVPEARRQVHELRSDDPVALAAISAAIDICATAVRR